MIKGTLVQIKRNNTYSSAFAGKVGKIIKVQHSQKFGTFFTLLFDNKVLSYPFYGNEFEEINNG